jgi:hypothetical protein
MDEQRKQEATTFNACGAAVARALINLTVSTTDSDFPVANAVGGMISECVSFLTASIGSDATVAMLDSLSRDTLMMQRQGVNKGVKVTPVPPRKDRP